MGHHRAFCKVSSLLAALTTVACASSPPRFVTVERNATQSGYASYYSDSLAGNTTANGERYDPSALTAAHRSLPFGTRVEVRRTDSVARTVIVRINDRGPFAGRNRIIDLSRAAATRLSMLRAGVVPVTLRVLSLPASTRH